MADIKTSISLNADASQAINEMNKVKDAVKQLGQDAQNTVVKPTVDATAVQQIKEQLQSTTINIPVSATPIGDGAAGVSEVGASANATTSSLSSMSATTGLAASQLAEFAVKANLTTNTLNSLKIAAQNVATAKQDLININSELQDAIAAVVDTGGEFTDAERASIKVLEDKKNALEDVLKKQEAIQNSVRETANKEIEASQNIQSAQNGIRGGISKLGEEYMRFSSGASAGMAALRSVSLNILSDINLLVATGKYFYELGNSIYYYVDAYIKQNAEIEKIARRTPEIQKQFEKLELKGKSPGEAVEKLNEKIKETEQAYAEASKHADDLLRLNPLLVGAERKRWLTIADAAKTQLEAQQKLRAEIIATEEDKATRRADYAQLDLLDAEGKIRRQAELDIAGFQEQLKSATYAKEKDALNRLIDYRKQKMDNDLKSLKETQDKAKDEELKRTLQIQDEAKQAQINNLDGLAKVNAQFQFDMDKLGRRLALAKSKEEEEAIKQLMFNRTNADLRNIQEVHDAKRKSDEDLAKKQKEDLRAILDLQRTQFDDMLNYQRQIVAGFNGLQQGLFPQEALQYLRQIAMGTNKINP